MMAVGLAAMPPDPTWRSASCWQDGATTYVVWDDPDADGALARDVCAAIAASLCQLGRIVFLGGPGGSVANAWRQIPGGWAGVSRRRLDWILRRPSFRFTASRDPKIVETLFDQPSFDWTLRGQVVFVLYETEPAQPPAALPDDFATCLEADTLIPAPSGCVAILRPGTDGAFAELHAVSDDIVAAFESGLLA